MDAGWSLQLQRLPSPAPLLLASNCSGTLLLASNCSGSPPLTCYTSLPAHSNEKVEPLPRSSTDSTTAKSTHRCTPTFSTRYFLFKLEESRASDQGSLVLDMVEIRFFFFSSRFLDPTSPCS